MDSTPQRITCVFGTRPEVIKMAPVVGALRAGAPHLECRVVVTAQHRQMLDQMLRVFGLVPDADLNLMTSGQSLAGLSAALLTRLDAEFAAAPPGLVLIQGDTSSACMAALAAFYRRIPVGHVEAGLRTFDRANPFPEEINRTLIGHLADLHFAPHARHREHLLAQAVPAGRIHITGNTVIDALHEVLARNTPIADPALAALLGNGLRTVLVTAHRRENFGAPMRGALRAIAEVAAARPDVQAVFPVHLNPEVRAAASEALAGAERVHLLEPLDYPDFLRALAACHVAVSDSGGVQEEGPALGKPVLVLRETTERPEVIEAGCAELVGLEPGRIASALARLLDDAGAHAAMARAATPYGNGGAAGRIAERCIAYLRQAPRRVT